MSEKIMAMLQEHGFCLATFSGPMPTKIRKKLFWNCYTFGTPDINYNREYRYMIRKRKWCCI